MLKCPLCCVSIHRHAPYGTNYHLNNIMPEGLLSAVFAMEQTLENSVKEDICQDLKNIGAPAQGVGCLRRVSKECFCIAFGKENYRNIF